MSNEIAAARIVRTRKRTLKFMTHRQRLSIGLSAHEPLPPCQQSNFALIANVKTDRANSSAVMD